MLHERLQQFARHDLLIPATLPLGNRERKIAAMFDRVAIPSSHRSIQRIRVPRWPSRKGGEKERERDDFRQLLPSTFRSRDIAKVYSHRAARNTRSTRSYCAIKLMAKEKKSERKPTDELDLWWKLVIRRSKENNLWIERNGCNVFFRSGRRVLYVKLIPRSGERFSIQGYSR